MIQPSVAGEGDRSSSDFLDDGCDFIEEGLAIGPGFVVLLKFLFELLLVLVLVVLDLGFEFFVFIPSPEGFSRDAEFAGHLGVIYVAASEELSGLTFLFGPGPLGDRHFGFWILDFGFWRGNKRAGAQARG